MFKSCNSSQGLQLSGQLVEMLGGLVGQKRMEEGVVGALQAGEPGELRMAKTCQQEKQLR